MKLVKYLGILGFGLVAMAPVAGAVGTPSSSSTGGHHESEISSREAGTQGAIYARLLEFPIGFEPNEGQAPAGARFSARGSGGQFLLETSGISFQLGSSAISRSGPEMDERGCPILDLDTTPAIRARMNFVGSDPSAPIIPENLAESRSTYFLGESEASHIVGLPTFRRVRYQAIYPGIDLVVYGNRGQIEYDFEVAPGADPDLIHFSFGGTDRVELDSNGDLIIEASGRTVIQRKPVVFQRSCSLDRQIAGNYVIRGQEVSFVIGDYDPGQALVIDPILSYSSTLPSTGALSGIGFDGAGAVYVSTNGIFAFSGSVEKYDLTTNTQVYSFVLGDGISSFARPTGLAVSPAGEAVAVGLAQSGLPVTGGAYQVFLKGTIDAFVARVNTTGTGFVFCTYFGGGAGNAVGDDAAYTVLLDGADVIHLTGYSGTSDFPQLNPIAGTTGTGLFPVPFYARFSGTGTLLSSTNVFATLSQGTIGRALALDPSGQVFLAGETFANNLPFSPGAFQTTLTAAPDGFVTKLSSTGSSRIATTYLGGSGSDHIWGITAASGPPAMVGTTDSTNFPLKNAFQPLKGGTADAFVASMNSGLTSFNYSSYLGGALTDEGFAIASDSSGGVYVTGRTNSLDFPFKLAFQTIFGGGLYDAFVANVSAGGGLIYSSYLGGNSDDGGFAITVDSSGNPWVGGVAGSSNFPTTSPVISTASGNFLSEIGFALPRPTILSVVPNLGPIAGGTPVTINGTNFQASSTVTFGGVAATAVIVTGPGTITCTTPAHAIGAVTVSVFCPDGQTAGLAAGFTYQAPAPTLTAVFPTTGPLGGGQTVNLTGTNFFTGATVTIGGNPATGVVVVSSTSINAVTPAHAAAIVDVSMQNTDAQTAALPASYQYASAVRGDANGNFSRTSADIFYLVNYLYSGGPGTPVLCNGDANNDTSITSADIFFLVNYLFSTGAAPAACP